MRVLSLLLCSTMTTSLAIAAAPPEAASPPPTDAAPAPQDIDVDAMARAKDVGNSPPPTSTESAPEAPAAASSTPAPKSADTSFPAPALTAPPPDSQEKRIAAGCEARATSLLDAAQKGDFATATRDFDAKMRTALPAAKFKEMWASLAQFGALQARGQSHPGKGEGYYMVMTPLIFDKQNLVAQVACGSDGRIAGFYVKPLSAVQ